MNNKKLQNLPYDFLIELFKLKHELLFVFALLFFTSFYFHYLSLSLSLSIFSISVFSMSLFKTCNL